jgi:hypothetical protein
MGTYLGCRSVTRLLLGTPVGPQRWPLGLAGGPGGSSQRCPPPLFPPPIPSNLSCPFLLHAHRPHSEGEHDLSIISNSTPTVQPQTCTTSPNGLEVPRSYARRYCVQADTLTSTFKNLRLLPPRAQKGRPRPAVIVAGPRPRGLVSHPSFSTLDQVEPKTRLGPASVLHR